MKLQMWNDQFVFRGSRPAFEDLWPLYHSGFRTIISLEEGWADLFFDNHEKKVWEGFGCEYKSVPLSGIWPPTLIQMEYIHALINSGKSRGDKVLFHCYSGVDRTGFLAAYLEVKVHGCLPELAWENAISNGMHKRYQHMWKKYFLRVCSQIPQEAVPYERP